MTRPLTTVEEAAPQPPANAPPPPDSRSAALNLGGMALRDGVMLQSERRWAAAVRKPDGQIVVYSGDKSRLPGRELLTRVPVVRGLARLAEAMAVLPGLRRRVGGPVLPQEDPRLLAATAVSALGTVFLRRSGRGSPVAREAAIMGLSLAPALLALRDSELSRFHGAEHKSVAAYETGGAAGQAAKEHDRCGSNLVGPLVITNLVTNVMLRRAGRQSRPVPVLVAGLASIGAAAELFAWMARHRGNPVADVLRRPGIELQRRFTTSEPSQDQLDVAQAALKELVRLEGAALEPQAVAGA
jgi:uncharacterized protein YqhQ